MMEDMSISRTDNLKEKEAKEPAVYEKPYRLGYYSGITLKNLQNGKGRHDSTWKWTELFLPVKYTLTTEEIHRYVPKDTVWAVVARNDEAEKFITACIKKGL